MGGVGGGGGGHCCLAPRPARTHNSYPAPPTPAPPHTHPSPDVVHRRCVHGHERCVDAEGDPGGEAGGKEQGGSAGGGAWQGGWEGGRVGGWGGNRGACHWGEKSSKAMRTSIKCPPPPPPPRHCTHLSIATTAHCSSRSHCWLSSRRRRRAGPAAAAATAERASSSGGMAAPGPHVWGGEGRSAEVQAVKHTPPNPSSPFAGSMDPPPTLQLPPACHSPGANSWGAMAAAAA